MIAGGKQKIFERREHERYEYVSPIVFLSERNETEKEEMDGMRVYARMCNYSVHGLYFESDYRLKAGSWIFFTLSNLSEGGWADAGRGYGAKIKWCRQLSSADTFAYGIGAEYAKPFTILKSEFDALSE